MMNKVIGILAHVDAGKTTFGEQLLYHMGVTSAPGKVDKQTSILDHNSIEKSRGITIFSDQSHFIYNENHYFLIDTPGHMDFSSETERAIRSMDYAVLIINGTSGVEAHTLTLFHLLEQYQIPVFFFLNKMDLTGASRDKSIHSIQSRLTKCCIFLKDQWALEHALEPLVESVCDYDDNLTEIYLSGKVTPSLLQEKLCGLIANRSCSIIMEGSASSGDGVMEFFHVFDKLTKTDYNEEKPFLGLVHKIRYDSGTQRLTFIKAMRGTLKIKQGFSFPYDPEIPEKINEIRLYQGSRFSNLQEAAAGMVFAVTGLKTPKCGFIIGGSRPPDDYILIPTLEAAVEILDTTDIKTALHYLRILEAEDPMLQIVYQEETKKLCLTVMGPIQLEVLIQVLYDRFSMKIAFAPPSILYRETIAKPIMGYGHFEPLRHYSEVNFLLEPGTPGSGIVFESKCHVDTLAANFQHQIKKHVFEKTHRGILTGAPLTDVKITLIAGRAHIKHTEGGDFREAAYRAIRQGLEKAQSILLEPFYRFRIFAPCDYTGKILSDIIKRSGIFDQQTQTEAQVSISGRGPAAAFLGYDTELLSFTKGLGSISFRFCGYEACHNPEKIILEKSYDKGADTANTSCSVFCSHGTSFVVNWDEAERYMHCIEQ